MTALPMPQTTTATVRRGAVSWELYAPETAELMGTAWLPLPLTPAATLDTVRAHVLGLSLGYTAMTVEG